MAGSESKFTPLSDEGELVAACFCIYCGELNPVGVEVCASCGRYIADQGPDLSARLKRIRRFASSVHAPTEAPQSGLIGGSAEIRDPIEGLTPADECDEDFTWRHGDVGPILTRITQVASHISPTPRPLDLELPRNLWLGMFLFAILLMVAVVILALIGSH